VATYDIEGAVDYVAKTKPETKVTEEPKYDIDGAVNSVLSLKETQKKRAATITSIASSFNPDEIAQLRYLGKQAGIPDAIAERNPAEVKRKALSLKVEQLYDNSPVTGRKLADPAFSKITHDITDELVNTESSMRNLSLSAKGNALGSQTADTNINKGLRGNFTKDRDILGNIGLAAKGGLIGTKTGALGSLESAANTVEDLPDVVRAALTQVPGGSVLGLMPNKMLQGIAEQVSAYFGDAALQSYKDQQANFAQIDSGSETETAAYQGIQSAVQTISTLPLAALTRNPYLLTVPMAGLTYGQSYTKGGAEGLDDPARAVYAGIDSVIEYGTEVFSISPLMKILKGQTGFVKDAGEFFVKDVIGEQVATFFQDMNEWGTLRPDATFGDFLNERGSAAYQTLIATLVGGSVQTGAAKGLSYIVSKGADIEQNNAKAESTLQAFAEIQKLSEQSTLKQRSAQDFATFLQEAGGENGIEEVYIDARTFMQEAQNLGVDVNTLMQSSPVIQKQLEEAIAQGIDLVIPVGEFGATIAGTDLGGAVLQHLRADENGISAFEAKTQLDTAVEELQKQAENVAQQYQDNEAWTQSLTEVSDNLLGQLNTLGRFTPENNQAYVSGLVAPWYSTLASNLGITPSEAYARYPLQVSGQVTAEGFEQGGAVLSNVIKSWDNAGIKSFVSENNGIINVSQIVVPENNRGNGVGSKAIQELIDYADLTNQRITLTPSTDYGATSKKRLTGFYKRFGFVENKGKNRDFSTMEGMYRDPNDANILNQKVEQKARGQISFSNDITQGANITLLKNADASTFIHELGHFFLEVYADVASKPDAPQSIVDDMNQLFNWFGIESTEQPALDVWRNMTIDQKRFYHEKLARGFEQYAMEGTAPTLELSRVFAKLRSFMLSAYKSLKQFFERSGEPGLTNEVRQVFDRMLASDEAINKAEAVRGMMPMFASMEEAGMSIDEYAEYLQNQQDATDEAKTALTARSLRDMKWLQGARSRVLKDLQRQADTERRMVRMAVRREVMTQPVYQAYSWLKQIPDETKAQQAEKVKATKGVDVEKDSLYTAIAKLGGLNRQLAASEWGLDPKDRFDSGVFGKPVLRKDGGLSVDEMAEALSQYEYLTKDENGKWDLREFEDKFFEEARGEKQYSLFAEGEQYRKWQESIYGEQERVRLDAFGKGKLDLNMMRGMYGEEGEWRNLGVGRTGMVMELGNPPDAVAELFGFNSGDQLIKSLLAAENPKSLIDRLTDERMLAEFGDLVDAKKMNEAADKAVHNEVRARVLSTELSAQNKALGNRRILEAAAKEYANKQIAKTLVRDLKPSKYARAESKSAQVAEKATRKGDTETAVQAKRDQLLNNRAAKSTIEAIDKIESTLKYLKKFDSEGVRKNLDIEYIEQIEDILSRFDLRSGQSLRALDKRKSLLQWVESQKEIGLSPVVDEELLNEARRVSYKDLPFEQFMALADSIRNIEHLGRLKKTLLTAKDKREFAERMAEARESINNNGNRIVPERATPNDFIGKTSKWGRRMAAAHRKFSSFMRELDGGKDLGVMSDMLLYSMYEAGSLETDLRAKATEDMQLLFATIENKMERGIGNLYAIKRVVPGTNISLTHEQRIMFAMNWGNDGNRQRLLDGGLEGTRSISNEDAAAILDTITKDEWDFIQGTWDYIATFKPMIAEQELRLTGREPTWIEPSVVNTKYGTYAGGYFPAKYDAQMSTRSESLEAVTDLRMAMKGAFNASGTRDGYTQARAEAVKGRPILLSFDTISRHIHEVTHRLAWQEWLTDATRVVTALDGDIRERLGAEALQEIHQHIRDVAVGDAPVTGSTDVLLSRIRTGTSIVGMGYRVSTALLQPSGIFQSWGRLGFNAIANGVKAVVTNPVKTHEWIMENSPMMRNRAKTLNREINEIVNQVRAGKALTNLQASYFYMIGKMQIMIDMPTYVGAYEKALAELDYDKAGSEDERKAIEAKAHLFAGQTVIDTQTGGEIKDLAGVQKGSQGQKLFTNFYSYFSALYNLNVENFRTKKLTNPTEFADFVTTALLLNVMPVIYSVALKNLLKGECAWDDTECLLNRYKSEQMSAIFGQMIGVRDIGIAADVATGGDAFGYSGPPSLKFFSEIYKFGQQVDQGEADMPMFKALNSAGGILFHYPAGQINSTLEGMMAIERGEVEGVSIFGALISGPPMD
jgi:GNAT superfamily N-acetyltransferase